MRRTEKDTKDKNEEPQDHFIFKYIICMCKKMVAAVQEVCETQSSELGAGRDLVFYSKTLQKGGYLLTRGLESGTGVKGPPPRLIHE